MKYLIGMDIGTSKIKAVLFDLDGKERKIAYRDNEPIHLGTSCVEQDMNTVWEKSLDCLKEIVYGEKKDDILGIGVTGQGEGCWLIDKYGEPVSNAILWCDGRAKGLVDRINKNKELQKLIYETTGTPVLTGTALTLLKWLKDNNKAILDKADKVLFCKDWVRYKLTGKLNLEFTDTATSLINIKTGKFAYDLFDVLGLDEYKHLLATEVVKSYEITSTIKDEIAEAVGLNKDTPVVAGAIDVIASTVGSGAIKDGDICSILGTTCATMIVSKQIYPGKYNTRYEMHAIDDLYVNSQPTMSGTPNIDWAIDNIADTKDYNKIDKIISNLKPGSGGVIYHPYISTSGERSPFYNPNARASFFGINIHTIRDELIRSVYEGVAFSIKDCLESSKTDSSGSIYLAGGGANSEAWSQIISDCTGKKVVISDCNEIAAKGVVLMLGVAIGIYRDFDDAVERTCRPMKVFKPDKLNTTVYRELFKLYKNTRLCFDDLWNERSKILDRLKGSVY